MSRWQAQVSQAQSEFLQPPLDLPYFLQLADREWELMHYLGCEDLNSFGFLSKSLPTQQIAPKCPAVPRQPQVVAREGMPVA
jgi:hypothetical protein